MAPDAKDWQLPGGCRWYGLLIAILLAGLVFTQAVQAWSLWEGRSGTRHFSPGQLGELYAVTLVTGPVYYARLLDTQPDYVTLGEVYYVVNSAADASNRRDNRLVSRRKNDWHSPESMTIPSDKILLLERVGNQSRIARLIDQDKALPVTKQQ